VIANNLSDPEKWVSSTKVNMLMRKIVEIFNNSPDEKIIIFSQWTTMLSMIEYFHSLFFSKYKNK